MQKYITFQAKQPNDGEEMQKYTSFRGKRLEWLRLLEKSCTFALHSDQSAHLAEKKCIFALQDIESWPVECRRTIFPLVAISKITREHLNKKTPRAAKRSAEGLSLAKESRLCRPILVFQNPLSQVGVRSDAFEIPFRGRVSRMAM